MNIEQDLLRALRRKPGPDDLAERVLARVAPARQPETRSPWRAGTRRWLAAAAAVALLATGGARYYAQQQAEAEAERVAGDIRLALQITSETLAQVQRRIETSLAQQPQGTP